VFLIALLKGIIGGISVVMASSTHPAVEAASLTFAPAITHPIPYARNNNGLPEMKILISQSSAVY
jgi:hypothetical protein